MSAGYKLVRLANGVHTVFSKDYAEKMHPGLGPAAEADLLYVQQLEIPQRMQGDKDEFVVWDIGLGAAANSIALLRSTRCLSQPLRLVSFDNTLEPLSFAFEHSEALGYLHGYESAVETVLKQHRIEFKDGDRFVNWELHVADVPSLLSRRDAALFPKPHAILFDPFSPAKNPAMWTLALFENLFRLLESSRPCALTTYSRSTMVRVSLLLAGFFVGRGRATGLKEETTVAANTLGLVGGLLDHAWLHRARKSISAEPLLTDTYHQRPLSAETWERLQRHAQFK